MDKPKIKIYRRKKKNFTDELKNKGIERSKDFAALTDILTSIWSGYTVKE